MMDETNTQTDSDVYTPEAKEDDRSQIASDIDRFLAEGGAVNEIPRGERADPPKKPENNYGRGSI